MIIVPPWEVREVIPERLFIIIIIVVVIIIINNNNKRPLTPKSMPPTSDKHAKLKAYAPNSKRKKDRKGNDNTLLPRTQVLYVCPPTQTPSTVLSSIYKYYVYKRRVQNK